MEELFDICTIVVTYYPNIDELKRTLYSIIFQVGVKTQIIICDDGTKNFNRDIIDDFFHKYNYEDYIIVLNEKNVGTVKNLYSAFPYVRAKLVKPISPKDYLYSKNIYKAILDKYNKYNFDLYVGNAVYYNFNNELSIFNKHNPIKFYKKSTILPNKKVTNQLIKYRDRFLGAALLIKKDCYEKDLKKAIDFGVVYCEDLTTVFSSLENRRIYFDLDYFIWYEYGTGVSTSNNSGFNELLKQDSFNFFKSLPKEYNLKITKKAYKYDESLKYPKFIRMLKIMTLYPYYYLRKLLFTKYRKPTPILDYFYEIYNEVE